MTHELDLKNQLLDRAAQLNQITEQSFLTLAATLSEIEETKAYQEAGYETYEMYVAGDLKRSKSTASKLLKVGRWIKESGFMPETLDTTYARLYQSINLLPEGTPEQVLSHASTQSEVELVSAQKSKKAGPHEPDFLEICTVCKVDKTNHD